MTTFPSIFVITVGKFDGYHVICAVTTEQQAMDANTAGIGDDYTEIPLLPAGHHLQKITEYTAKRNRHTGKIEVYEAQLWEFDDPGPVNGPLAGWHIGAFFGTDRDAVIRAAEHHHATAANLCGDQP